MGEVSLLAGGPLAGWCNPALLADQSGPRVVEAGGAELLGSGEGYGVIGASWRVSDRVTVGAAAASLGASVGELDADANPTGNTLSHGTLSGGFLGAVAPLRWLECGLALKGYRDDLEGVRAQGCTADAGLKLSRLDGAWWGGVAMRNLPVASGGQYGSGPASTPPVEARAGFGCDVPSLRVRVGVEVVQVRHRDSRTGVGAEWRPWGPLAVRLGMIDVEVSPRQLTMGLSFAIHGFDFAYALATHPLGVSNRVGLSYAFGNPNPPDRAP
jgi:hypothetical protein